MSATIESLSKDWLNALGIVRRALDSHDIRGIWSMYEPHWSDEHPIYAVEHHATPEGEREHLMIYANPKDLAEIERVELLTYAAVAGWWILNYPGDPFRQPREAFQNLCTRAGCYWGNTPSIRERWRLIDFYSPAHTLPLAVYETRLRCGICKNPVATGAGGFQTTTGAFPKDFQQEWQSFTKDRLAEAGIVYRPDLHEECLRYAHRVLVPLIKEGK